MTHEFRLRDLYGCRFEGFVGFNLTAAVSPQTSDSEVSDLSHFVG